MNLDATSKVDFLWESVNNEVARPKVDLQDIVDKNIELAFRNTRLVCCGRV